MDILQLDFEIITVIACYPISGLVTMISHQTPWWLGVRGHDQSVMQMGSEITMIGCSVSAESSIQCPSVNIHNCRARPIYIRSSSAYSSNKCHNRVLSFKSVCCHTICNKCRTWDCAWYGNTNSGGPRIFQTENMETYHNIWKGILIDQMGTFSWKF